MFIHNWLLVEKKTTLVIKIKIKNKGKKWQFKGTSFVDPIFSGKESLTAV